MRLGIFLWISAGLVWEVRRGNGSSPGTPVNIAPLLLKDPVQEGPRGCAQNKHSSLTGNGRRHYIISPGQVFSFSDLAVAGERGAESLGSHNSNYP